MCNIQVLFCKLQKCLILDISGFHRGDFFNSLAKTLGFFFTSPFSSFIQVNNFIHSTSKTSSIKTVVPMRQCSPIIANSKPVYVFIGWESFNQHFQSCHID